MAFEIANGYKLKNGNTGLLTNEGLIGYTLLDVEFERGSYEAAGQKGLTNTGANSPRARVVHGIIMNKGDYIANTGTGGYSVIYSDLNGETFTDSGWLLNSGDKFTAPYDGVARVTLRRVDSAAFDDTELDIMRGSMVVKTQYSRALFNKYGRYLYNEMPANLELNAKGYEVLDYNLFDAAGILNDGSINMYAFFQVATKDIIYYDVPLELVADSGYEFDIFYYDNNDTLTTYSGWITSVTIPANQKFKMTIRESPIVATKRFTGVEWLLVNHVKYKTVPMRLIDAEISKNYAYSAAGVALPTSKTVYNMELLPVTSTPVVDVQGVSSYQGFTINNGVIFQLFSDNKVELIDYTTGEQIAMLDITSDHGDTIDFSNEYYQDGDEFPLAYITAETTPAKVYVNRITRTGTTLVKTYTFPADKTGYYAGHSLDPVNKILYQIGYTENSYYQDPNGTNYLIVSVWDLKTVTDNGNNVYTPAFVRSFKLPFYTTLQGQAFFNGLLFVVSSHWSNPDTIIIVIDPSSDTICNVMTEFNSVIKTEETEGLAFVENGNKYDMILKPNEPRYYKVVFG